MRETRERGVIPGRPGERVRDAASPWLAALALPLGALLGVIARLVGWR